MYKKLKNLERIEFIITYNCTGKCKHCSVGEIRKGDVISPDAAAKAVEEICEMYKIKSVMTFGGEGMLYPESVYAVHKAATNNGIAVRQLITNGYFTEDLRKIQIAAKRIKECGINDVLLSADSFHQETIPLEIVKKFGEELLKENVPVRVNPAWLVSKEHDNPHNTRTKKILKELSKAGLKECSGNVIFPEGNAKKYLGEYFEKFGVAENPYNEDPNDLKSVSIEPDGTLLSGNIYKESVRKIFERYECEK